MPQSHNDDIFDELATFAQCVYLNLTLVACKRRLSEDECWLLQHSIDLAERLMPRAGEAFPMDRPSQSSSGSYST